MSLDQVIGILVLIVVGMTGWGLLTLVRLDAKMSGFHQWLISHEKLDDVRMENISARFDGLDKELKEPIKEIKNHLDRLTERVTRIEQKIDRGDKERREDRG